MIRMLRKLRKEESGASLVMVALCMVVIFGFTAFAVDLGNAYKTKVEMQDACDLSALAAASELPERAKTEKVAKEYAELNGFDEDLVEVDILEDGTQVEVRIAQDVDTYFAGVIGYDKVPVACKAVAAAGERGPKDYAIFSGTEAFFGLHGNVTIPNGDIHANGAGDITGTLNIPNGVIEVPKFNNQGSTGDYETYVDPENIVEMPNYVDIINKRLHTVPDDGYTVIDGDFGSSEYVRTHTVDRKLIIRADEKIYAKNYMGIGSWLGIDEVIVEGTLKTDIVGIQVPLTVNGNMVINDYAGFDYKVVINGNMVVNDQIAFRGEAEISGTVVASGTINFANAVKLDSATVVCDSGQIEFQRATVTDMYSDSGYSVFWGRGNGTHININANIDTKALLYAPTGECIMDGGNVKVKGSITANQVGTNNGDLSVELPKDDEKWEFSGRTKSKNNNATAKLIG